MSINSVDEKIVDKREIKIYFKGYFEHLERKLKIAKKIAGEDISIAFLICIANLEGMSYAWESKSDLNFNRCGERFVEFLERFCELDYLKGKNKKQFFWNTFRCSFAHSGMIDSFFVDEVEYDIPINFKFIGDIESPYELKKLNGIYYQFSINHIFEIYQNCLDNLKKEILSKTHNFNKEFFIYTTLKCKTCNYCYPKFAKRCPFCKDNK